MAHPLTSPASDTGPGPGAPGAAHPPHEREEQKTSSGGHPDSLGAGEEKRREREEDNFKESQPDRAPGSVAESTSNTTSKDTPNSASESNRFLDVPSDSGEYGSATRPEGGAYSSRDTRDNSPQI